MAKSCSGRWSSSTIQSVLLRKSAFPTKAAACAWVRAHDFKCDKVDAGGPAAKFWHVRQKPPGACDCKRTSGPKAGGAVKFVFCGRL